MSAKHPFQNTSGGITKFRRTAVAVGFGFGISMSAAPAFATSSNEPEAAPERLRLVISLKDQKVDVYRGLEVIKTSKVSTGRKGYSTPAGVYSILQKNRHHRSNIYRNAPMPYMQRLTWSGIALHEGNVSRRYASHGCIRLPRKFARELFGMTKLGADVIVVHEQAKPVPIQHSALFQPFKPETLASIDPANATTISDAAMAAADSEAVIAAKEAEKERSTSPLRILVTRRTGRERTLDLQRMLKELGHDPGEIDGFIGSNTGAAIQAFQRSMNKPATGMVTEELYKDLHAALKRPESTGHIYVRQDRKALFDAPAVIRNSDLPLGTHVYASGNFDEGASEIGWTALTMTDPAVTNAGAALKRIGLPADIRKKIEMRLTPGSSMIISDDGLGRETGKGTDFIVQPRRLKAIETASND